MAPLYLMIALHYHCTAGEYPYVGAPAVESALAGLVEAGLLRKLDKPTPYGATFERTGGLAVYVKALCDVPFPVKVWQMPDRSGVKTAG
jgi:hypothetical protein